jgi:hypothetical protein
MTTQREIAELQRIEQRARRLIAAINRNLDTKESPFKWTVPWKEARLLMDALR